MTGGARRASIEPLGPRPLAREAATQQTRAMTMPTPDDDREAEALGSDTAPPGDPDSQGGTDDGVAGPSYPPAGTEPDAS